MDLSGSKKPENEKGDGLEYVVMPKLEKNKPRPVKPVMPAKEEMKGKLQPAVSGPKRTALSVIAALLAIAALSLGGYYAYGQWKKDSAGSRPDQKASLDVDVSNTANPDVDADGLDNAAEIRAGTAPDKPDTDQDGLADGDELNVYGSNPLVMDTDSDKYNDGYEVAGGYSPVVNSAVKGDLAERQKWLEKSVEFGLHEPTGVTLKSRGRDDSPSPNSSISHVNSAYGYSIEYPDLLTLREHDGSRIVGLYISGTEPEEDIMREPFVIRLAGQTEENQTLKEWIEAANLGESFKELSVGGLSAFRVVNSENESGCNTDWTLFLKERSVIGIAWTCNTTTALEQFYNDIVNSFKFK